MADPAGPVRTCVGCRRRAPAAELVRIALDPSGALVASRVAPGRGAWLCERSATCLDLAVRRGGFARALRRPVDRVAAEALAGTLGWFQVPH